MFNVGDKFVIELEKEHDCSDVLYYKIKGLFMTLNETQLKALDRYSETDGKEKEAYTKGLNDAWELAKKLESDISVGDLADIFGKEVYDPYEGTLSDIIESYTATEALEKVNAYEKEKSKIRVGDEVVLKEDHLKMIVTFVENYDDGKVHGICVNPGKHPVDVGGTISSSVENWQKTGKHYDEIEKLLVSETKDKV